MHDLPLITTVAAGFSAAWLLGILTQRLGLSPIVGYLVAGVLIGPYTPGFVGDLSLAQQLAEIGVILLMFGVGLHFHLKDLLAVKAVAIPGAVGQSLVATVVSCIGLHALGLPIVSGAVLGMAMAVASTVVLMRVLLDNNVLHANEGHVAVGWLLVEDVLTVIVLVLIPVLGSNADGVRALGGQGMLGGAIWLSLAAALLKLVVLVALLLVLGSRIIPRILVQIARLRSRELFTLTVLVFSIAIAAASYFFFGASMALGAFLAGMVVAQSPVSHQVASDALPLRDAFAVLFFVSVGMLFDPSFLIREPGLIIAALAVILIAKPLSALIIVAVLGYSVRTALTVAIGLAQIGEFSFILSDLARANNLLPQEGHSMLVAAAIISITLNPMLFRAIPSMEDWLKRRPLLWGFLSARAEGKALRSSADTALALERARADEKPLAVLIGYGPVGRSVHRLLDDASLRTVVVDLNMDTISELNAAGVAAVYGDATQAAILEQAGLSQAAYLVVTTPDPTMRVATIAAARDLNSNVRILVRARYIGERENLKQAGATAAVFEEAEVAIALARLVMMDTGAPRDTLERATSRLRIQLILETQANLDAAFVRDVMVPWNQVRRLASNADGKSAMQEAARFRHTRFPVEDPVQKKVDGYLYSKDLLRKAGAADSWFELVRPLPRLRAGDNLRTALHSFERAGTTIALVEENDAPVGMITLEDIVARVVNRVEADFGRDSSQMLRAAIERGAIVLDLGKANQAEAISTLLQAIPANSLPPGIDARSLGLSGEDAISSDVGCGAAFPNLRFPGQFEPIVAIGRSSEGIIFSPQSEELVKLIFLSITPDNHGEAQLLLLSELAEVVTDQRVQQKLLEAGSPLEIVEILFEKRDEILPWSGGEREQKEEREENGDSDSEDSGDVAA